MAKSPSDRSVSSPARKSWKSFKASRAPGKASSMSRRDSAGSAAANSGMASCSKARPPRDTDSAVCVKIGAGRVRVASASSRKRGMSVEPARQRGGALRLVAVAAHQQREQSAQQVAEVKLRVQLVRALLLVAHERDADVVEGRGEIDGFVNVFDFELFEGERHALEPGDRHLDVGAGEAAQPVVEAGHAGLGGRDRVELPAKIEERAHQVLERRGRHVRILRPRPARGIPRPTAPARPSWRRRTTPCWRARWPDRSRGPGARTSRC